MGAILAPLDVWVDPAPAPGPPSGAQVAVGAILAPLDVWWWVWWWVRVWLHAGAE